MELAVVTPANNIHVSSVNLTQVDAKSFIVPDFHNNLHRDANYQRILEGSQLSETLDAKSKNKEQFSVILRTAELGEGTRGALLGVDSESTADIGRS